MTEEFKPIWEIAKELVANMPPSPEDEMWDTAKQIWGDHIVREKLVEELAELIQAIQKVKRFGDQQSIDSLYAEIADVEFVLERFKRNYKIDKEKLQHYSMAKKQKFCEIVYAIANDPYV